MKQYKKGDIVRLYKYPKNDINAYAKIMEIFSNERVWIANLNMPFSGSISLICSKEQFEKMISYQKRKK